MMLDATAGNRIMWNHANNDPPNVIFIDKELRLAKPPNVFADNRYCPFRDNIFDCVIYDPPHYINAPPWFTDPTISTHKVKNRPTFFGSFKSKREMMTSINKAQKEFQRLTSRLCLKWGEHDLTLWQILPFFRDWKLILKKNLSKGKGRTWWVTFVKRA